MMVFAHRGSSGAYPENTMLAFRKAVEEGADGIELDVHLSKDGEVMIVHDESLVRTAGIDRQVWELTRCELEKLSAGRTQNDEFGFTPVPSLEEYLCFIGSHKDKVTNIEIKSAPHAYPGLEEKVLSLVARCGLEDNVIYSSFNWLSIVLLKRVCPECRAGLLFAGMSLENMGQLMRSLDIECYHPYFRELNEKMIEDFHENGRAVNVWTVNEPDDIRAMITLGADGIISNYPQRVLDELGRL